MAATRWRAFGAAVAVAVAGVMAGAAAGCGASGPPAATWHDAATLRAEQDEWREAPADGGWVRREVLVWVDAAPTPSGATSVVRFHGVRTAPAGGELAFELPAPAGARVQAVQARAILGSGAAPMEVEAELGPAARAIDPGQRAVRVAGVVPAGAALVEVRVDLAVAGTLAGDARPLGAWDGPTAELFVRYDLPGDAEFGLQVVGATARPVVTEREGRKLVALLERNVPAAAAEAPVYVRYVTRRVAPKGYEQRVTPADWAGVAQRVAARLVAPSVGYRQGYAAPVVAKDAASAVRELTEWTRDRLQREDALEARWDAGRALPALVTANDLTATDKVHLLHWLLDAAQVPHQLAVARTRRHAPIDAGLADPGVFDVALVYAEGEGLWLDPACGACEPGQVRPELRGQPALLVSRPDGQLKVLPK